VLIFQITIDGLRTSDNATFGVISGEVLGKQACVGVRVITTDDGETVKVKGFACLE
jgi:hypothetical protein